MPLTKDIMFQARVDAILKVKGTEEYYNYSLKTMAEFYEGKTDRTFKLALQTLTEQWAAQEHFKALRAMLSGFDEYANKKVALRDKRAQLQRFTDKYMSKPPLRIFGTRHCFLIKGGKAKQEEYGMMGQSPLIRGYKQPKGPEEWAYAHSYYYPNPSNKSEKGSIGSKWQPFNVWEEMTVKEWIALLASRVQDHETREWIPEIQPECGDVLKQQVVTPPENFANQKEIDSMLVQITEQEKMVFYDATQGGSPEALDISFPMNRHACLYPSTCEFLPICHLEDWKGDPVSPKVRENPIESGMYVWRVPHHDTERKALEKGESTE